MAWLHSAYRGTAAFGSPWHGCIRLTVTRLYSVYRGTAGWHCCIRHGCVAPLAEIIINYFLHVFSLSLSTSRPFPASSHLRPAASDTPHLHTPGCTSASARQLICMQRSPLLSVASRVPSHPLPACCDYLLALTRSLTHRVSIHSTDSDAIRSDLMRSGVIWSLSLMPLLPSASCCGHS